MSTKSLSVPSLTHTAVFKIAITLWNLNDIKALRRSFNHSGSTNEWSSVEESLKEKVSKLFMPELMKDEIITCMEGICEETSTWEDYHEVNSTSSSFKLFNLRKACELSWTPQGTLDRKGTAEKLIKDLNLDVTERYKLACMYCLEKDVPMLWKEIPENRKGEFYNEDNVEEIRQHKLVTFWTYSMMEGLDKLSFVMDRQSVTPTQFAFEYSALSGNLVSTLYFFEKLTPEESNVSLIRATELAVNERSTGHAMIFGNSPKYCAEVVKFLNSKLDKDKWTEILKRYCRRMITSFAL